MRVLRFSSLVSPQAMNGHLEQDITEIIERDEAEAAQGIIPSLQDDCSAVNLHEDLEGSYQSALPQSMSGTFMTTNQPIMSSTTDELARSSSARVHVVSSFKFT